MPIAGAAAVTAVVWAVSLISSVRLRALVYSLPVPMTVALVASGSPVDGGQVLGVALLVGFFAVVGYAHQRLGWPIALADAAGITVYLGAGAAVAAAGVVAFVPALAAVCILWLVLQAAWNPGLRGGPPPAHGTAPEPLAHGTAHAPPAHGTAQAPPAHGTAPAPRPAFPARTAASAAKLLAVFAVALLMVALGGILHGLVVTFPYSGVLVAVEVRAQLAEFTRHFARTSLALVAFLTGCWLLRDAGQAPALLAGWLAFGVTAAALART